jgi:hypothetical protein
MSCSAFGRKSSSRGIIIARINEFPLVICARVSSGEPLTDALQPSKDHNP